MSFDRTQAEIVPATDAELDPIAEAEAIKLSHLSLDALTTEAKSCQEKIAAAKGRIVEVRAEALANACAAGHRLLAIRQKLPHGRFGSWIKDSGLKVSQKTVERYMALAAKSTYVANLPVGTSLRKAYLSLGILSLPPSKTTVENLLGQIEKLQGILSQSSLQLKAKEYLSILRSIEGLRAKCKSLICTKRSSAGSRCSRKSSSISLLSTEQIEGLIFCHLRSIGSATSVF